MFRNVDMTACLGNLFLGKEGMLVYMYVSSTGMF